MDIIYLYSYMITHKGDECSMPAIESICYIPWDGNPVFFSETSRVQRSIFCMERLLEGSWSLNWNSWRMWRVARKWRRTQVFFEDVDLEFLNCFRGSDVQSSRSSCWSTWLLLTLLCGMVILLTVAIRVVKLTINYDSPERYIAIGFIYMVPLHLSFFQVISWLFFTFHRDFGVGDSEFLPRFQSKYHLERWLATPMYHRENGGTLGMVP